MHPVRILFICAVLAAGGCAARAELGDAVSRNMAAHVVDPNPAGAMDTSFGLDGDRAALAIARYKANDVKEPRELRTSDVGASTGGGGE